jgi:hypothetical protein
MATAKGEQVDSSRQKVSLLLKHPHGLAAGSAGIAGGGQDMILQIKTAFMNTLRGDYIRGMLVAIHFRIFCFHVSYLKM